MKQYIDKSALVAEIERRATFFLNESKKKTTSDDSSCVVALYGLLSFLDTLEVKEVDSNDAFIEKACEWMSSHLQMQYDGFSSFIKDFRKAMKGK